jgi:hypothetical protein
METMVANFDYSDRIEEREEGGRKYVVASATILKEGVLHGSQGPLFYPEDEIKKDVGAWNGIPITLGHPKKGATYVLFKDSDYKPLGFLRNDRVEGVKRKVKVWFDVEATDNHDKRILENVRNKKAVGLSTGLITDNHPVQNKNYKGTGYIAIAKNYRPDHLAILVDQPGACSIKDGCGINVNQAFLPQQQRNFFQNLNSFLAAVPPEFLSQPVENANPQGCNQHTGPGCSTGGSSLKDTGNSKLTKAKEKKKEVYQKLKDTEKELQEYGWTQDKGSSILSSPKWGLTAKAKIRDLIADREKYFREFSDISDSITSYEKRLATRNSLEDDEDDRSLDYVLIDNEESLNQKIRRIHAAFREKYPPTLSMTTSDYPMSNKYIVDIYEGYVVYRDGERMYWQSYEETDKGITFKNDSEEVVEHFSYEPVSGMISNEGYETYGREMIAAFVDEEVLNANPKGCNQHTGPGCSTGSGIDTPKVGMKVKINKITFDRDGNEIPEGAELTVTKVGKKTKLSSGKVIHQLDLKTASGGIVFGHSGEITSNEEPLPSNQDSTSISGDDMFRLSDDQKKQIRDELTANQNTSVGSVWKGVDLKTLSDDALVAYHKMLKHGSQEIGVVHPDGSRTTYNQKTGQFEHVPAPTSPQNTQNGTGDKGSCGCKGQTNNEGQTPAQIPASIAANIQSGRPKSMTEALDQYGTPEEKAAWAATMNFMKQQTEAVLSQIIGNVQGEQERLAAYNLYKDMTLPQLQIVLSTMPKPQMTHNSGNLHNSYGLPLSMPASQAAAGPGIKALPTPTYNFRAANS